jgi:polysaccharide chain length determinant protein (PEP-CTERM system associated)
MIPKEVNYEYILTLLRRRLWYIVIPFFFIFMGAIVYCIKAPKWYRSTSTILIQPEEVSADFVRPTVSDVNARLRSITDEVLSKSALEHIITELHLCPGLCSSEQMDDTMEGLRKRLDIHIKDSDIGIRDSDRSVSSFEISFEGQDPATARTVTAAIASLYLDYEFRRRADQTVGTLEFVDRELERMREVLREKEDAVRHFKERNRGWLPQEMENNSRTLAQLHQQLDSINTSLQKTEDRKVLIQTQLSRLGRQGPNTIEGLRQELERLQSRYSDQHPDVLRLKALLAKLEKGEKGGRGRPETGDIKDSSRSTDAERLMSFEREDLSEELKLINRDISALLRSRENIQSSIEDYRRRVEGAPIMEQKFLEVNRDYKQASDTYQSLLQKKLQAQMGENLERSRKGVQLRILDPANLPRTFAKPNIPKMLSIGLVAALGCGFGLAFLLEFLDRALWSRKELEDLLGIFVLGTVPFIYTAKDRRWIKVRRVSTVCALCVMGAALVIGLVFLWQQSPPA